MFGAALLVITATSAAGLPPAAQDAGAERGAALVRQSVEQERVPGAVLLVARDGRVVLEEAYGWAQLYEYGSGQYGGVAGDDSRTPAIRRLGEPRPMSVDTIFDLASLTKVMATTFAVMLLVDTGELELDAPLRSYLEDFRDADPDGEWRDAGPDDDPEDGGLQRETGGAKGRITLRHLLTHRAGLYQWQPVYYHAGEAEEAYEYVRDLPLGWGVGEGRHYSDLGFMLLGLVVERIAGEPLSAFLQERLYGPLGLRATGFRPASPGGAAASALSLASTSHGNPFEHRMVHDPDFGYRYEGDPDAWHGWREYTLTGEVNDGNAFHAFEGMAGHAGLFSTAADLQVLLQLLLNRGEYAGRRYLSAEVVDEFLAPAGDGQALGWLVPDYAPPGSFAHTGFTGTYVLGVPAEGVALVLLTNRQNLGVDGRTRYPDIDDLQRAVAAAVLGS